MCIFVSLDQRASSSAPARFMFRLQQRALSHTRAKQVSTHLFLLPPPPSPACLPYPLLVIFDSLVLPNFIPSHSTRCHSRAHPPLGALYDTSNKGTGRRITPAARLQSNTAIDKHSVVGNPICNFSRQQTDLREKARTE
jgi:hypothetical protein